MPLHPYENLKHYTRNGKRFFRKSSLSAGSDQFSFPLHLPEDLRRFKQLTMGKPIIMGKNTYLSIGRALPGRYNLVLSSRLSEAFPETLLCSNKEDAYVLASRILRSNGTEEPASLPAREFLPSLPAGAQESDYAKFKGEIGKASGKPAAKESDYAKFKGEIGKASGKPAAKESSSSIKKTNWKFIQKQNNLSQAPEPGITESAQSDQDEIFIVGGSELYRQTVNEADRMYITIADVDIDGDVFFPAYDLKDWEITQEKTGKDGGWDYRFLILDRKR